MDKRYWIGRERAAIAMARKASTAEARLIHYELAGRYSIKAAHCPPFQPPGQGPPGEGRRETLHLSAALPRLPLPQRPEPRAPRDPGVRAGEAR